MDTRHFFVPHLEETGKTVNRFLIPSRSDVKYDEGPIPNGSSLYLYKIHGLKYECYFDQHSDAHTPQLVARVRRGGFQNSRRETRFHTDEDTP